MKFYIIPAQGDTPSNFSKSNYIRVYASLDEAIKSGVHGDVIYET